MPTAELNKVAARMLLDITLCSLVVISVIVFVMLSVTKPGDLDNKALAHGKESGVILGSSNEFVLEFCRMIINPFWRCSLKNMLDSEVTSE